MNLVAMKLSSQDRKDLEKFTKFLTLKSVQVIVQSRLGEKKQTKCSIQPSSADWFNLAIEDLPDVIAETKKALNGEVITNCLPLCVEISLKTVEGDQMFLEYWCLDILPEQCNPSDSSRVIHRVYNQMGILLKSLVSVTRVTPAYKLSRRQGPDSYVIFYHIFMGEPQLYNLGDGYKQVRVGQICTPIGTIQLGVSYRTKMTITPTHTGRDNSIMLKSDHFNTNLSPRHMRYKENEENNISLSNTMKMGAFVDNQKHYEPELIIPNVPFGKLLSEKIKLSEQQQQLSKTLTKSEKNSTARQQLFAATTNNTESTVTIKAENDKNGNSTDETDSIGSTPPLNDTGIALTLSSNEDFIMVDLKTPFATNDATNDLRKFCQWKSAPPLQTFSELPTISDQVPDLTKQLEQLEFERLSCMKDYDDIIQSLCQSPNNN